ncbi:MAG TPA: S8 family serine peptidase, partial [Chloroflexia bacterium]
MQTTANLKRTVKITAVLAFALALCVAVLSYGGLASAGAPATLSAAKVLGKIEGRVLQDTANGKSTSFVVLTAQQADLSKAYGMKDQDARGWYVYNTLKEHAAKSQAGLRAMLDSRGIAYKSFWAASALVVTGNRSLVESLAAREDVRAIESNAPTRWIEEPEIASQGVVEKSPAAPDVAEWGVMNVNAPQVWAMGFTGQGIVIGNQDTGMRWTHNALKPKYRGWDGATANHNFNWWDAIHSGGGTCGPNTTAPCDDQGHGTHTTGTTVGDDGAGNQVGVAPGAKWIGCRNMNVGAGTPATYSECFQFFIAPTDLAGQNANPALRPHVMNNSWGCPTSEGCAANTLQAIVESTQAAGIFVEVSAGNAGSACSTVNDPPAIYAASFSTGATDINNVLASFSSRGPVTVDGSNRRKPDISAPGVNVRSSTRTSDTSYGNNSGTSMAGPHVVGVVALLWSAHPSLSRMITETKTILQNTANPNVTVNSGATTCGGIASTTIPNNHFGYGRVDALAAVNSVTGGTVTPVATGTAVATGTPCAGVSVWTFGPTYTPGVYAIQGGVAGDGNFYVAGGQMGNNTPVPNVARFNSASNTFTALPNLPVPVGQAAVGVTGTKMYVAGGYLGGTTAASVTSTLQIFDTSTNTWTFGAPMPAAKEAAAGVIANGKFYVIGGDDFNATVATNYVYDIAAGTWSVGTPLPAGRTNTNATAVGNIIYLFGGAIGSGFTADDALLKFDTTTNTWTTLAPAGVTGLGNYGGISTFGAGKLIVTVGGSTNFVSSNRSRIYDITGNSWTEGPLLNESRMGHAQGTLPDGRVIVVSGLNSASATRTTTELLPSTGAPCPTSTVATVVATSTSGPPTITPGASVTPGATATCVPVTGGWTQGALLPMPLVRAWGVYFPPNGKFYAMGGRTADGTGTAHLNP